MNTVIILLVIASAGFSGWSQWQNTADNHGCAPSVYLDLIRIDTVLKFRVNKPVYAAPVVMGDTLYAATSDGRLIAINRKNGAIYWTYFVPVGITSTPAADGGKLYVGGRDGIVRAINRFTGQQAWQFSVDDTIPAEKEIRAHLKLTADRLYVGSCNGKLYCLDLSGNKRWDYQTHFYIKNPVAVKDSVVILSSMDEAVYCLIDRGNSCALKWVNRVNKYGDGYFETLVPRAAPIIADTTIFLSYVEGELNNDTRALSWSTGAFIELAWDAGATFNTTGFAAGNSGRIFYNILGYDINPISRIFRLSGLNNKFARSNAAPAVLGNCVVFHSSFYPQGIYFVLNNATTFKDSLEMAGYSLSSSFAAADSVLYFGTYEGYILGMGTGQPLVIASHDSLSTGVCLSRGDLLMEPVQISPNPFNPSTGIRFSLATPALGEISVYTQNGRLIKVLSMARFNQGRHVIAWDGKDKAGRALASGVYVIRARIGHQAWCRKATLVR